MFRTAQAARSEACNTAIPKTIMVLEPDVIVRSEISEFLRQCGYDVIEGVDAADLRAALESGAASMSCWPRFTSRAT